MRNQKGFTVIELLIVVAITGMFIGGLGSAMYQMVTVTEYGEDRMSALHDVQNAAYWFTYDGQRAVSASLDKDNNLVFTLQDVSTITYSLDTKKDANNVLRTTAENTLTLAQNVTSLDFTIDDRTVTMSITSLTPGRMGVSEQGTFEIYLRTDNE